MSGNLIHVILEEYIIKGRPDILADTNILYNAIQKGEINLKNVDDIIDYIYTVIHKLDLSGTPGKLTRYNTVRNYLGPLLGVPDFNLESGRRYPSTQMLAMMIRLSCVIHTKAEKLREAGKDNEADKLEPIINNISGLTRTVKRGERFNQDKLKAIIEAVQVSDDNPIDTHVSLLPIGTIFEREEVDATLGELKKFYPAAFASTRTSDTPSSVTHLNLSGSGAGAGAEPQGERGMPSLKRENAQHFDRHNTGGPDAARVTEARAARVLSDPRFAGMPDADKKMFVDALSSEGTTGPSGPYDL